MQRFVGLVGMAAVTAAALLFEGCAATSPLVQLNDPARSTAARDVANLLPPRDIPYETIEKGSIALSYNLFFVEGVNLSGYRLTLIIRNNSTVTQVTQPVVSLQDADGLLLPPYAYDAFVGEAASLAGTPLPPVPPQGQPTNYYSSGTIRNMTTGTAYEYSGTTTTATPDRGFAAGFARGMAQSAAIQAAHAREEGRLMLRWANAFWLRSSYELPSGSAASGALFFPAASLGQTPPRLTVDIAGEKYTFVSVAR